MERKEMVEQKRRVAVTNVVYCVRPSKKIKGNAVGTAKFDEFGSLIY